MLELSSTLVLIGALGLMAIVIHRQTIPRRRYLMRGKLVLIKGGKYEAPQRRLDSFKL